jgi:hypothetical protein
MTKLNYFLSFFPVMLLAIPGLRAEIIAPVSVSGTDSAGSFTLVSGGQAAPTVIDASDAEVVEVAAMAFVDDIRLLTGVAATVQNTLPAAVAPVIVGTLGKSAFIDQLAAAGKITASEVEGKWEMFGISVIDDPFQGISRALVIYGSDPRGTAFGIFELSRMMGVSPWVWWADVKPATREAIYIAAGKSIFGPPSVQYRGFFINDEDWAMQPWAARNMDKTIRPSSGSGDMGPNTYARIFELMLRMKSNCIWPAMHACTKAFWYYPGNPETARKYSIILGSSHCEQMLRNNEDEWRNNFQSEYGHAPGDWNWATNSANITKYWTDRVKQAKNTEAVYTMGMRGIHDSGIPGYNTDAERRTALMDIIAAQRELLTAHLEKPLADIPQVFIPYKEVLRIYNLGVNVPGDVTLMWADDNFGYMRQLSNPAEQARSGGGGVYYHFSYLGPPQSYLWLESVSPSLAAFELRKAYDLNCKKMWIFNVGDVKPQEFILQFAMDLAWDIHSVDLENPNLYAKRWGREIFGQEFAESICQIKREYFHLASAGKPEHVASMTFTVDEMEKRIAAYDALTEEVQTLEAQIPAELQDAYFQLIKYPVEGAAAMNAKHLGGKLSFEYGAQARKQEAVAMSAKAVRAFNHIIDLTKMYNLGIAGGKWNGMMSYSPNRSAYFYDPAVVNEEAISQVRFSVLSDSVTVIPAHDFTAQHAAGRHFLQIDGLGISEKGLTVYPYDMTAYTAGNIAAAPCLEYTVPVLKGENAIAVQCLPGFPMYRGLQLRYAISINGSTPEFKDVETVLEGESSAAWGQNVMNGYSQGLAKYASDADKNVTVRVYFADPALVVSAVRVTAVRTAPETALIVNSSFEYAREGQLIASGIDGWNNSAWRPKRAAEGEFYGWKVTSWDFRASDNYSQGMNQDNTNREGNYACWIAGNRAFPDFWEFYQVIPADRLEPGTYRVQCRLAVEDVKRTSQRLFANQSVQYHGTENQYAANLTADEISTFAGHPGGTGNLQEMTVYTTIGAGDSLKIGIRTGRIKGDGSTAGNADPLHGWFKADYFRLERVKTDSVKAEADPDDYTGRIVNPGFEYRRAGELNVDSTFRGTPYGWLDTGGIVGNSFGINGDALNLVGANCSWYMSTPMPAGFELYQTISGLPAGKYTLSARMAVMDNRFSTQRLFANSSVQYFGKPEDYGQNVVQDERCSFAGWNSTSEYFLKNMSVDVEINAGDPLKIGVRSGNRLSNGQTSTGNEGWFKVDDFRLKFHSGDVSRFRQPAHDSFPVKIAGARNGLYILSGALAGKTEITVYSLPGTAIHRARLTGNSHFISLPPGVYIVSLQNEASGLTEKVAVR